MLRTTTYELSLWSDDRQPAPEENPEALASIEGHIDITGIAEAVVLAGPRALTLTLEDGRRLAFELTGTGVASSPWLVALIVVRKNVIVDRGDTT